MDDLINKIKENREDIFETIEDFDLRVMCAINEMAHYKCSLRRANIGLYNDLYDAVNDWLEDNGYERDILDDEEIEEIIF